MWAEGSTWTQRDRAWLARQRFDHIESELAYGDYLATVDAAAPRKATLSERSRVWLKSPTCGRRWRACVPSAGSTPSPPSGCSSSSAATGRASTDPPNSRPGSGGCPVCTSLPRPAGLSPRPARSTRAGCSSSRPGTTPRAPYLGPTLAARQEGVPTTCSSSWRAQRRLHRVFRRLKARGKPANLATVAVARELARFLWAAGVAD